MTWDSIRNSCDVFGTNWLGWPNFPFNALSFSFKAFTFISAGDIRSEYHFNERISISLQSSTVIIIITPTRKSPHVKRHELSILVNPLATFTSLESSIQCSLSLLLPWLPSVLTRSNKHWENNSNFENDNAGFSQLLRERALYLRRNQLIESFWFSLKAWPNLFNFPLNSWTFMAF